MKPPFNVGDVVYKNPTAFHSKDAPSMFIITAIESDPNYDGGFKVKTTPPMNSYANDHYVAVDYFIRNPTNAEILEVF